MKTIEVNRGLNAKKKKKSAHYFDSFSLKGQSIKVCFRQMKQNVNIITSLSLENILEIISHNPLM